MNKIEKVLREKAAEQISAASEFLGVTVQYVEHVSPDAIDGDAWLENGTSYIWKIGLLGVVDGNKADWCTLYIGHQRDKSSSVDFIGSLSWNGGENDDVGRCLYRYVDALNSSALISAVFQDDDHKQPVTPGHLLDRLLDHGFLNAKAIRESLGMSDSLREVTKIDILKAVL